MLEADKILRRFEALESARGQWDGIWQTCSDYVLPRLGQFNRKSDVIFDSTAPLAVGRFSAALESLLTPRDSSWHSLSTGFPKVDQNPEVNAWLEAFRDMLFKARYWPESNFSNQLFEAYLSLGVHGTAVIFIDDDLGRGIRYQCIPVYEVYLAEDSVGRVDTVFRWYSLSARQALSEFGDQLPEEILRDAEDPAQMGKEYEFIHGVFPRGELASNSSKASKLPVASVHIAKAARKVVRESGYRSMPYAVSRFSVAPGEVYGRSPAMDVMPDIVQVNAMKKTIIRAAEKMVNPPLLTPDDDVLSAFSLKAGSINYGGLDDQGRQRVVPLELSGNLPIGLELIEQGRKVINEGFYLNLFQLLLESPQKTATEVIEMSWEKAQFLAPSIGRQQSELLSVIIRRELDILIQAGIIEALPPMPKALEEVWGRGIFPKYESDMSKIRESRSGQQILNAFSALSSLAQADPNIMSIIDLKSAGRFIWSAFGAPASLQKRDDEIQSTPNEDMASELEEFSKSVSENSQKSDLISNEALNGLNTLVKEALTSETLLSEGTRGL